MYVTVSLGYVFQKSEMGLSKDSEILHGLPTNKNIRISTTFGGHYILGVPQFWGSLSVGGHSTLGISTIVLG